MSQIKALSRTKKVKVHKQVEEKYTKLSKRGKRTNEQREERHASIKGGRGLGL
jgi:hypothetical protein